MNQKYFSVLASFLTTILVFQIASISIVIHPAFAPPPERPERLREIEFDRTRYEAPIDTPKIQVIDTLANRNSNIKDSLSVKVSSGANTNGILISVPETGPNTAIFTTTITLTLDLSSSAADKRIKVNQNDFILARIGALPNSNPLFNAEASIGSGQPPLPPGDLFLKQVRPVQASSDPVVLVNGKETLIRVLVDSTFGTPIITSITLSPAEFFGTPESVTVNPGSNVFFLPSPSSAFLVPGGSTLETTAVIDPNNTIQEGSETNNAKSSGIFTVKPSGPFTVLYLPIIVIGDTAPPPTCPQMMALARGSDDFLNATFPVDDSLYSSTTFCKPRVFIPAIPFLPGTRLTELQQGKLLFDIDSMAFFAGKDKGVGVVRSGWFGTFSPSPAALGVARMGDQCPTGNCDGVLVEQQTVNGITTAHEIGHSFGLVRGTLDDGTNHYNNAAAPGFWVHARTQMVGLVDFMNRPGGSATTIDRWVSSATWNHLLDKMKDNSDPKLIFIRGVIFKNDTSVLDPWYRSEGNVDIPLNNPGEYKIFYLDNNGEAIGQTGFDLSFRGHTHETSTPIELDFGFLSMKIPDLNGTNKIILKHGDQLLAERTISSNPPAINITSPDGQERFNVGDKIKINWTSSDADRNNLTYVVSISKDGGENWLPLASDFANEQYILEATSDLITDKALIRVTASDGINTDEDISNSTFSIVGINQVSLSGLTVKDINGNTVTDIPVGSPTVLSTSVANSDSKTHAFTTIVEVRNEDNNNNIVFLQQKKGTLNPSGKADIKFSFIPNEPGVYTIRTIVVTHIDNRHHILSPVEKKMITVD